MSGFSPVPPTTTGWFWMRRLVDDVETEREIVWVGGEHLPRRMVSRSGIGGAVPVGDFAGREWLPVDEIPGSEKWKAVSE
jgi:hypothetical protein